MPSFNLMCFISGQAVFCPLLRRPHRPQLVRRLPTVSNPPDHTPSKVNLDVGKLFSNPLGDSHFIVLHCGKCEFDVFISVATATDH